MSCPLCSEQKYFTLRDYKISDLTQIWKKLFDMDPFEGENTTSQIEKRQCVQCSLIYYDPEYYGDNQFYEKLSQYDWYYESEKWEFAETLDLIRQEKPSTVLEIGCGSGQFLHKIAHAVDYCLGLDINRDALTKARTKGLNVSDQAIDSLDQKFDMVVMFQVLEHLPTPMIWLKKMTDRLNSRGTLVIAVPNPASYMREIDLMVLDMPPHHNTGWSKDTFDYLQRALGLERLQYRTESINLIHYHSLVYSVIAKIKNRKLVDLLVKLAMKLAIPFMFLAQRDKIVGQTHLIALKKPL